MDEVGKATLDIGSSTENLATVREFMAEHVQRSKLPKPECGKVILAVDEACANIIKHSYHENAEGQLQVTVAYDDICFEIVIRDAGVEFDPNAVKEVDIMEHVKQGRKTGLGIFLMRQIMDEVEYTFRDGESNRLRLVKYMKSPKENPSAGTPGAKGE
jgi:serine/threonine-protein kinase RsbW